MLGKRRSSHDPDESEPVIKQAARQDYFSALPTEMLLEIFGHLNKKEGSIKSLAQTCLRFHEILTPHFKLCLDFDRIMREGYPVITRSYKYIKVCGSEIDVKHESIAKLFASSASQRSILLTIGKSNEKTRIKMRTLLFLMRTPGLIFLHIQNLRVLAPQLKLEAIRDDEYPKLPRLISLMMNDNKGPFLSAFKKITPDLKALIVVNQTFTKQLRQFMSTHKKLVWLHSSDYVEMKADSLPLLTKLEFNFTRYLLDIQQDIFAPVPKVEHLKLYQRSGELNVALLQRNKSATIQSIEFEHAAVPENFTAEQVLPSYPSLIAFKSSNYQWSKK